MDHWFICYLQEWIFSFAVHKLEKFSSNPRKLHFEGLLHVLRYIRYNTTLGSKYYAYINDAHLSDLLIQDSIKTENQLVSFSDYSCKDFPYTGRSTGEYIVFYQCGSIDHGTHVPGKISQSIAEIEYNAACTAGMALANFRMLIHELLNKDPDIVPEEASLIILYSESVFNIDKNGNYTKHTRHIAIIVHFVSNGESWKMHNIDWCKVGLQLEYISTKNFGETNLNPRMKYIMLRLDNWDRTLVQNGWQDTW